MACGEWASFACHHRTALCCTMVVIALETKAEADAWGNGKLLYVWAATVGIRYSFTNALSWRTLCDCSPVVLVAACAYGKTVADGTLGRYRRIMLGPIWLLGPLD